MPAARRTGLGRPRSVGEDRAQPPLERAQVHARPAKSPSRCAPTAATSSCRCETAASAYPPDELPHLFERFHRIRDVAARSHEGSGIGLALVNELARLHGGTVGVESALGIGSTFTVRLPCGNAHLPAEQLGGPEGTAARSLGAAPYVEEALRWLPDEARPEAPAGAELLRNDLPRESPAPRGTGARILIADDNADMRAYLARLLRRYWQVETVADGAGGAGNRVTNRRPTSCSAT